MSFFKSGKIRGGFRIDRGNIEKGERVIRERDPYRSDIVNIGGSNVTFCERQEGRGMTGFWGLGQSREDWEGRGYVWSNGLRSSGCQTKVRHDRTKPKCEVAGCPNVKFTG